MSLDEDDLQFLRNAGHLDTPDFGNSQVRLIKSSPIKKLEDFEDNDDQVNYTGSSLRVSDFSNDFAKDFWIIYYLKLSLFWIWDIASTLPFWTARLSSSEYCDTPSPDHRT